MVAQPVWGTAIVHYPDDDDADPDRMTVLKNPEIGEELIAIGLLGARAEGQRWRIIRVEYRDEAQEEIHAEIWIAPFASKCLTDCGS
jgi:hypothetical protein